MLAFNWLLAMLQCTTATACLAFEIKCITTSRPIRFRHGIFDCSSIMPSVSPLDKTVPAKDRRLSWTEHMEGQQLVRFCEVYTVNRQISREKSKMYSKSPMAELLCSM